MKAQNLLIKALLVISFTVCAVYIIKSPKEHFNYYETISEWKAGKTSQKNDNSYQQEDKKINEISTELRDSALPTSSKLKDFIDCKGKDYEFEVIEHGNFRLLKNYARVFEAVKCHETVTYTTHSDFTFLDNLPPLLQRWMGPISVALYAPGDDFESTTKSILHLRNCHQQSHLVKRFATFHIFFEARFLPKSVSINFEDVEKDFLCSNATIWPFPHERTFKVMNNLTYPVNVGRNLARDAALTHFVLASDIELYPNSRLIDNFFDMISRDSRKYLNERSVFVLPIFEIEENQKLPSTKAELVNLFNRQLAVWFHFKICPTCHTIPKASKWLKNDETEEMRVFTTVKRQSSQNHWEPLYIGTNAEPLYDERLSWEGKSDKMTQAHIMCLLNYDFNVLSNAFLIHKPGIKSVKEASRPTLEAINKKLIVDKILPEIKSFYGERKGCQIF